MRTHYCKEVSSKFVKKEIVISGWVNNYIHLKRCIFLRIRDITGNIQVIIKKSQSNLFELASNIRKEYVIEVKGFVSERPSKDFNDKIKNGQFEVLAVEIKILNESVKLPFYPNNYQEIHEENRLKYRHIDLRNNFLSKNIIFRYKLVKTIRNYLDGCSFLEIETPILTKSTPEGARDYLVPSRIYKKCFFALPQSPQIFKQLLMIGGFDRYFQIARCFRDEDLRSDRQPEFTQLDIELSFTNEEQIL